MLAEYKKKGNIGTALAILTAVVLGIIAAIVTDTSKRTDFFLQVICILPTIFLFIYGLYCYAKGKGYHGAWGLLGILTIIGLLIIAFFPDRHKLVSEEQKQDQNQ